LSDWAIDNFDDSLRPRGFGGYGGNLWGRTSLLLTAGGRLILGRGAVAWWGSTENKLLTDGNSQQGIGVYVK